MDRYLYLGFRRFAGRGLRYIAAWCGTWIAPAAGSALSWPRDRSIGWSAEQQFRKPHLIADSTRLLIPGTKGVLACLVSFALAATGSPVTVTRSWPLVENLVNPALFGRVLFKAANRQNIDEGFARRNGW